MRKDIIKQNNENYLYIMGILKKFQMCQKLIDRRVWVYVKEGLEVG